MMLLPNYSPQHLTCVLLKLQGRSLFAPLQLIIALIWYTKCVLGGQRLNHEQSKLKLLLFTIVEKLLIRRIFFDFLPAVLISINIT